MYTEFSHDPKIKHKLALISMDILNTIYSKLMNFNFSSGYDKLFIQADCSNAKSIYPANVICTKVVYIKIHTLEGEN